MGLYLDFCSVKAREKDLDVFTVILCSSWNFSVWGEVKGTMLRLLSSEVFGFFVGSFKSVSITAKTRGAWQCILIFFKK